MAPHHRTGLLACIACVALGAGLAIAAHLGGLPIGRASAHQVRQFARVADLSGDVLEQLTPAEVEATPTPSPAPSQAANDEADSAEPEPAAPAPRVKASSVFRGEGRGALACRIPGRDDFRVEWDAGQKSAVADFSGARLPGSMTQELAAGASTLDSRVSFALEQDGHRLAMTINDSGAMRASVDGQESNGTCSPA